MAIFTKRKVMLFVLIGLMINTATVTARPLIQIQKDIQKILHEVFEKCNIYSKKQSCLLMRATINNVSRYINENKLSVIFYKSQDMDILYEKLDEYNKNKGLA